MTRNLYCVSDDVSEGNSNTFVKYLVLEGRLIAKIVWQVWPILTQT